MKVKVLSLLVSALPVIGVADAAKVYNEDGNKLDLYGKVDGLHYFSDNKDDGGDKTYMRIGFRGEAQVNDQLTGYDQWKYQAQGNQSEASNNAWARVAFAGFKFADAGSSDYGRNYGVTYDVTSWIDALPEFDGGTYGVDNFMQQRGNSYATYHNTDFFGLVDGLSFALQYQGKNGSVSGENVGGRSLLIQNGDGYDRPVTYDIGAGFGVGGAITASKRIVDQNAVGVYGSGDRATIYTGGLKYDVNNVYLAAQYSQSYSATRFGISNGSNPTAAYDFADKAQNLEVVVQYQFDFGLRPSVAYLQSKGKDISSGFTNYGDQDTVKYVDVGATYYFDKNTSTYVDHKINLLDDNNFIRNAGTATDDIVALGLVYQF